MIIKFRITNRAGDRNIGWIRGGKWFSSGQTRIIDISEIIWATDRAADNSAVQSMLFEVSEKWVELDILTDLNVESISLKDLRTVPASAVKQAAPPLKVETEETEEEVSLFEKKTIDDRLPERKNILPEEKEGALKASTEKTEVLKEPREVVWTDPESPDQPKSLEENLPKREPAPGMEDVTEPSVAGTGPVELPEPREVRGKKESPVFRQEEHASESPMTTEVGSDILEGKKKTEKDSGTKSGSKGGSGSKSKSKSRSKPKSKSKSKTKTKSGSRGRPGPKKGSKNKKATSKE